MNSLDFAQLTAAWRSPEVIGIGMSLAMVLFGAAAACYKAASEKLDKSPDGATVLNAESRKRLRKQLEQHVTFSHLRFVIYTMFSVFSAALAALAFRVLKTEVSLLQFSGMALAQLFALAAVLSSERFRRQSRRDIHRVSDDLEAAAKAAEQSALLKRSMAEIDAANREGMFPNERRPVRELLTH